MYSKERLPLLLCNDLADVRYRKAFIYSGSYEIKDRFLKYFDNTRSIDRYVISYESGCWNQYELGEYYKNRI